MEARVTSPPSDRSHRREPQSYQQKEADRRAERRDFAYLAEQALAIAGVDILDVNVGVPGFKEDRGCYRKREFKKWKQKFIQ